MAVAVIYDIHGNLPALEAVLREIRDAADENAVEEIVVGGDILPGPLPAETLDCLLAFEIPMRFLYGNGDRDVLAAKHGQPINRVPEQFRDVIHWHASQLSSQHEEFIFSWPATQSLSIGGIGEVLFCHATPQSDYEIFTRLSPEERLRTMFADVGAQLVVCGHTHMPFDRTVGEIRVVNAGSVGMPFGKPGASWLLIGSDVEFRHTDYDREAAAKQIAASSYPQAAEFAQQFVLNPPSEEQMLGIFAKADRVA